MRPRLPVCHVEALAKMGRSKRLDQYLQAGTSSPSLCIEKLEFEVDVETSCACRSAGQGDEKREMSSVRASRDPRRLARRAVEDHQDGGHWLSGKRHHAAPAFPPTFLFGKVFIKGSCGGRWWWANGQHSSCSDPCQPEVRALWHRRFQN